MSNHSVYSGTARTASEVKAALEIAANIFLNENTKESVSFKEFLLVKNPNFDRSLSTIVVCDNDNCVMGSAFVLPTQLELNGKLIQASFLSNIAIRPEWRGQGLSITLMNACLQSKLALESHLSIVIARRAVDRYYQKFNFFGASSYPALGVNRQSFLEKYTTIKNIRSSTISEKDVSFIEVDDVNRIYCSSYLGLNGRCIRSREIWLFLVQKFSRSGIAFRCIRSHEKVIGYYISNLKDSIYEIGFDKESSVVFFEQIADALTSFNCEQIKIFCQLNHPILESLKGVDFTYSVRECDYGGHMIRVNAKASQIIGKSQKNILREMNILPLSNPSEFNFSNPFNILMADQI